MTAPLLEVEDMSVSFGGVHAVADFNLRLEPHARVAVIGPNGAGKSTVVRCIAGDLAPDRGDVRFAGRSVRRMSPSRRARLGIARTFQNLELFLSMSVLDNVLTALDSETRFLGALRHASGGSRRRARARETLALFGIADYADVPAEALPYGVRKLVELSRALVTEPSLLLLDEPVAGLADTKEFVRTLTDAMDQRGSTVVLVEHDMPTVQTICEHVYVLDSGRTIAQGDYSLVSTDPRVVEAYLGRQSEQRSKEET